MVIKKENGVASLLLMILPIVVVVLIIGGYYLVISKNTTSLSQNTTPSSQQIDVAKPQATFAAKEVNQFFPKEIMGNKIQQIELNGKGLADAAGSPYYVGPWNLKEVGIDGIPLKHVPVSEGYKAIYGVSPKQVVMLTATLTDSADKTNLKKLLDTAFPVEGTLNVPIKIDDTVMVWAMYSSETAKDVVAGDARLLFNDLSRYMQIQVIGTFSKVEFISLIKNYLDSLKNANSQVVSLTQMMNMAQLLEAQAKQKSGN